MRPEHRAHLLASAVLALLAPASAQSIFTPDDYTEAPFASTPFATTDHYFFQSLSSGCDHRTVFATELNGAAYSVSGGQLHITADAFEDSGEIWTGISCGPLPGFPLSGPTFGVPYATDPIDLSSYDSFAFSFDYSGSDPLEFGIRLADSLSSEVHTAFFGSGSHSFVLDAADVSIDLSDVFTFFVIIESMIATDISISLDPLTAYAVPPPVNYCTPGTQTFGCQSTLSVAGMPSAQADEGAFLIADGQNPNTDGLFFYGTNGRQAMPWGNGTSFQCVVPPVSRTPLVTSFNIPFLCLSQTNVDLDALWCSTCPQATKNPGPGAVVQAQLWYRDPMNTSNQTTSLSDAIEFVMAP